MSCSFLNSKINVEWYNFFQEIIFLASIGWKCIQKKPCFWYKRFKYCFSLLTSISFSKQHRNIVNFFSCLFEVITTFSILQFSLNSYSTHVKDIFTFVLFLLVYCKANNNIVRKILMWWTGHNVPVKITFLRFLDYIPNKLIYLMFKLTLVIVNENFKIFTRNVMFNQHNLCSIGKINWT